MQKISLQYDQTSVRLQIEGLPDTSLGHSDQIIGIISSWRLQLVASPELEGRLDHLQAIMQIVIPYARYSLSGVRRTFGEASSPASICPNGTSGHQLLLRSSQEGIEPLNLDLDDAELSDLVRCLDSLRFDPRVSIVWNVPTDLPLRVKDLVEKVPAAQRFTAPLLGLLSLFAVTWIGLLAPTPRPFDQEPAEVSFLELKRNDLKN